MNCNITLKNKKFIKVKKQLIFIVKSSKIKGINCPASLNSSAIDEFLIIFLIAAKAKEYQLLKNCLN